MGRSPRRVFSPTLSLPWPHLKNKAKYYEYTMASDGKPLQKPKFASFLTSQKPIEIFDKICSYLNMADFLIFRQVCKRYYQVENLQRCFNPNILLRPFVSDPRILRSELGKHDALISGVFALNFFEFGWSNVPVLDLFVEAGGKTDGLVAYIKDREDYDKEDYLEITMVRGCFCWITKRICSLLNMTGCSTVPLQQ
jgi:hypothetical protein